MRRVFKVETRDKEELQGEKCKDPDESTSAKVNSAIRRALTRCVNKNKPIWLITDLHLWVRDKGKTNETVKRSNFDHIIKQWNEMIKPDDFVICLGDLVDGEFTDKEQLKDVMLGLNGNKILVRGNNDLFDYGFYRSCGFQYVVFKFTWNDIVFTHYPITNKHTLNIHGHLHNYKKYYIPYTNQIDVFNVDRKPQLLLDVIQQQPSYAKEIIEVKPPGDESVSEQYTGIDTSGNEYLFIYNIDRFIYESGIDPCTD